jgi:hypothetical protein
MSKYVLALLMMATTAAHAGQASGRISVGIRIVAESPAAPAKTGRTTIATTASKSGSVPYRRFVTRDDGGRRIQTLEF